MGFMIALILVAIPTLFFYWIFAYLLPLFSDIVKLRRAIYIADEELHILEMFENWSERVGKTPYENISPDEIYAVFMDAKMRGQKSLRNEIKREGKVCEL